jgi:hypothetical protein
LLDGAANISALSTGCDGVGARIDDRAHWGWHERGAGDHEAERNYPSGDPEGA